MEEYLSGKGTILEITVKYGISNTKVFRRWILKYNTNIELKSYDPKREVYMAEAGRMIDGEEAKLRQLAEILLDNACKYNEPGSTIRVSLKQVAEKKIRFTETSQGTPLTKEEQKRNEQVKSHIKGEILWQIILWHWTQEPPATAVSSSIKKARPAAWRSGNFTSIFRSRAG